MARLPLSVNMTSGRVAQYCQCEQGTAAQMTATARLTCILSASTETYKLLLIISLLVVSGVFIVVLLLYRYRRQLMEHKASLLKRQGPPGVGSRMHVTALDALKGK